jgi:hypothetical protein
MARVSHTFSMLRSPSEAQEQFLGEMLPFLSKAGAFVRTHEEPGRITLSDGVTEPSEFPNQDGGSYPFLRRLTAHRLKVAFEASSGGTTVTVSGSATRDVRRMINALGT